LEVVKGRSRVKGSRKGGTRYARGETGGRHSLAKGVTSKKRKEHVHAQATWRGHPHSLVKIMG